MKILCVEDDENLAKLLLTILTKQHYQVDLAGDGESAWDMAECFPYDLILLDLVLPKLDGINFCKKLRVEQRSSHPNSNTPILLMTALDSATNKVLGLDAGADDYVVKPLNFDELLARVRALLRRSQRERSPQLTWGELSLDPSTCEVTYRGQIILLSSKEYELLELFLRNPDHIFSPSRLIDRLWTDNAPTEGTVRSHMKGLRHKLKQAGIGDIFETFYKMGYRLRPPEAIPLDEPAIALDEVASNPLENAVPPELQIVWQEVRQSYCDRVDVIQACVTALRSGAVEPEQHRAEREAHTLVGSLGSFGLLEASQIARKIQRNLAESQPPTAPQMVELEQLLQQLRNQMQYECETATVSSDLTEGSFPQKAALSPSYIPLQSLLMVEDDVLFARSIALEAANCGVQTAIALTTEQAQEWLDRQLFSAILLNLDLQDSTQTGVDFLSILKFQHPDIPVMTITAHDSLLYRVEAARHGRCGFMQKPTSPKQVMAALGQMVQQDRHNPARLLIVHQDSDFLQQLKTLLDPCGYRVSLCDRPEQIWVELEQVNPQLLILNAELHHSIADKNPGNEAIDSLTGFELCQVIRQESRWSRLPVLLLTSQLDPTADLEKVQSSFAAGADAILPSAIAPMELLTQIRTSLQWRLWLSGDIDELTGLSARPKGMQDLTRLLQLAQRQRQPFSLAVLDLDQFRLVNDRYGEEMGDRILSDFGALLAQSFRKEDVVTRWSGEEFVIGLYGIIKQEAARRIQEVLNQFRQCLFAAEGNTFCVTFSAGVAQAGDCDSPLPLLYKAAIASLHQAKAAGRNRVNVGAAFDG